MKRDNSMHTLTHPITETETILISESTKRVGKFIYKFLDSVISWPFYVNVIALITIGWLIAILDVPLYLLTVRRRKKVLGFTASLTANLEKIEYRRLMLLHLELEESTSKLDSLIIRMNTFYLFTPITNELKIIFTALRTLEITVFDYLYPEYHKPLTEKQADELIEAFKTWDVPQQTDMDAA